MDNQVFAEGLTKLDTAGPDGNTVEIDRLYYKFPVDWAKGLTAIVGPMARNTEALGIKPTAYKTKTLNFFGGHGVLRTFTTKRPVLSQVLFGSKFQR